MSTDSPGGAAGDPGGAERWPPNYPGQQPDPSQQVSSAQQPPAPEPFDPYRFGAPDHPIDPAYAPPGYRPPAAPPGGSGQPTGNYGQPAAPYGQATGPYGQVPPPYGQATGPYGQPPGYPPAAGGQPSPYGYPQPTFGQLPNNAYPGGQYGQQRRGNGFAVTGLVLGILSILFCWANFIDIVLFVPAIIFAIVGISASKTRGSGRGMAIAGLITGIIGTLLAVVFMVVVVNNLHCSNTDDGSGGTSFHCTSASN